VSFENNTDNRIDTDPAAHWSFETQLSSREQLSTGVSPGSVRLAVRIEGIESDLEVGFAAARAHQFSASSGDDPRAVAASRRSR